MFSYSIKTDNLSVIYFKQRELLYKIIWRNVPLDEFHEAFIKNIIIGLSSIIIRINTASLSLSQYETN